MSLIKIYDGYCDLCKRKMNDIDGYYIGIEYIREIFGLNQSKTSLFNSYGYKIHICDRCIKNIKKYCVEHGEDVSTT